MTVEEIVARIEAGLEGATPGPWRVEPQVGHGFDYVRTDHPSLKPTAEDRFRDVVASDMFHEATTAHIACCDPDTIRALIASWRERGEERDREMRAHQELLIYNAELIAALKKMQARYEGGQKSMSAEATLDDDLPSGDRNKYTGRFRAALEDKS